ncbi:hypothetical protein NKH18_38475 [Streptomyces sp. M10(2022)]
MQAALYIGDKASKEFKQANPRIAVDRDEIRRTRPDILITNYKMLDLMLQRPEDQRLWQEPGGSTLAYVVLDEFHTYDGAQGTDVAMLLRRLGAVTDLAEPGRPLGPVCPVATSATLGEGTRGAGGSMLDVAQQVFGVPFPPDAVVGRSGAAPRTSRETATSGCPSVPDEVADIGDPATDPTALDRLAAAFTGKSGLDAAQLGRQLRRHRLTAAVLEILDGRPRTMPEIMDVLPRYAYHWGVAVQQNPAVAARALARYVALLSTARDPDRPSRPLLSIEVHHWVRSVSRCCAASVRRGPSSGGTMSGSSTAAGRLPVRPVAAEETRVPPAPPATTAPSLPPPTARPARPGVPACRLLPGVRPVRLGRALTGGGSGGAGDERHEDPPGIRRPRQEPRAQHDRGDPHQAYDAAFVTEKPRSGPTVLVLDGQTGRVRPLSRERDFDPARDGEGPHLASRCTTRRSSGPTSATTGRARRPVPRLPYVQRHPLPRYRPRRARRRLHHPAVHRR